MNRFIAAGLAVLLWAAPCLAALTATATYLNNYVRHDGGTNTTMPTGDYTVCMWAKRTGGAYSVRTTLFHMEGGTFNSDSTLGTTSSGVLSVVMDGTVVVSGGTVTDSTWKYACLTHSGTTFQIWLGDESTSITSQGSATHAKVVQGDHLQFFADDWNGFYFDGAIAYPRMWDAALSGADLEAERQSATPVRSSGLWAYWDFSTASATITDSSGGGRTLTKAGTVTTTTDPTLGGGGGGPPPATGVGHRRIMP